jgi:uncharacterized phage protein (TIGR01671 family)
MNNREIKFRVWDKKNSVFQTRGATLSVLLSLGYQGAICSDHEGYVYQQFTGLNDRNGTPIFEGDIVRFYFDNPEVSWTELVAWENFGWVLLSKEDSTCPLLNLENMEIIGNILEHAERF